MEARGVALPPRGSALLPSGGALGGCTSTRYVPKLLSTNPLLIWMSMGPSIFIDIVAATRPPPDSRYRMAGMTVTFGSQIEAVKRRDN